MKYILIERHFNIPDKELIADLRRTAKKLRKKSVTCPEYTDEGRFGKTTYLNRFGSWNASLEEAGLEVNRKKYFTRHELMQNLKKVWDKLGRQPGGRDMKRPLSKFCSSTYRKEFGSWSRALNAFLKFMKKSKGCNAVKKILPRRIKKRKPAYQNEQISKSLRYEILRRDNYKCVICGASPANDPTVTLHVDHIIPRCQGGRNTRENLQTLCNNCNLGKGTKPMFCSRPAKHRFIKRKKARTFRLARLPTRLNLDLPD